MASNDFEFDYLLEIIIGFFILFILLNLEFWSNISDSITPIKT